MPVSVNGRWRRLWRTFHLWIALTFAALLVPVSLSGALLVWHDELDALVNPSRYAASSGPALAPSTLMERATNAVSSEYRAVAVRFPEGVGWPAKVNMREQRGDQGGRPRVLTVYLDPATGRVLDVTEFRYTLIGFLHRFHENLTIPEYEGRAVVGWSGVAMLIMSLTGIYLWWPRSGFRRGLRWRRGPTLSHNLHHLFGFWIAIPLAIVSLTGIYLGFPQQSRQFLSNIMPTTPIQRGGFNAPLLQASNLSVDGALEAALKLESGMRAAAVFVPTRRNPSWRVQLRHDGGEGVTTVMVEDKSGAASKVVLLPGDHVARWIRWIHEGSNSGPIWKVIVFLSGLLPAVFMWTGIVIWLRSRVVKNAAAVVRGVPQVDPAE
jgi:uncharacterized iron-regulated membrane protein